MSKRMLLRLATIATLVATVLLFIRYFIDHPQYWRQLAYVSPWTIVWVIVLNFLMIGVLAAITSATLRLCGKRLAFGENFLLTIYSSIANFFGPLQSGPGVRAVYLKTKHQVRLRDYTLASLLALGLFAVFNALFLLVGTRPWWQTVSAIVIVAGVSVAVIRMFARREKDHSKSQFILKPRVVTVLALLTLLQVCITVGWYYVELKAVNPHIHFSQAVSYAGAANFALFVSITPDAIGIREGFLVFSKHIHHVSTANIVSANLIDRGAYVIFLGILFIVALSVHAKSRLQIKQRNQPAAVTTEQ